MIVVGKWAFACMHVKGPVIQVKGHIVNKSSCQFLQPVFTAGASGGNHCHADEF